MRGTNGDGLAARLPLRAIAASLLWLVLNICITMSVKEMFIEDFKFPLFLLLLGFCFDFVASSIMIVGFRLDDVPVAFVKQHWKLLVLGSCFSALSAGLQNVSVSQISLSLNQIIKSTAPILIMAINYVVYAQIASVHKVAASVVLLLGVCFAVYGKLESEAVGVFTALLSVFFSTCSAVISGTLLREISPLALLFCSSLPGFVAIAPLFFWLDYGRLHSLSPHSLSHGIASCLEEALGIAFLGFCYVLTSHYVIQLTSPMYHEVLATLKVVILVVLSMLLFGANASPLNILGVFLALLAFALYNYFSYAELSAPKIKSEVDDALAKEQQQL